MAIVYRHIRLDKNEPFYIGIAKNKYRPTANSCRNITWKRIVNKTKYDVEILFDDLTWEEACEKEKELIKLYGRKDIGTGTLCNMTDGGEGTLGHKFVMTEERKKKISKSNTGKKLSSERIEKMKSARWGENYEPEYKKERTYGKGRIFSEEHRKKLSDNKKGKKFTEEHRNKLSNAKIKPEELKKKRPIKPPKGHHLRIKIKDVITNEIYDSITDYKIKLGLKTTRKAYTLIKKGILIKLLDV